MLIARPAHTRLAELSTARVATLARCQALSLAIVLSVQPARLPMPRRTGRVSRVPWGTNVQTRDIRILAPLERMPLLLSDA